MSQVKYRHSIEGLSPRNFTLVRSDWASPPSPALTFASLREMKAVIVAMDEAEQAVGFICGMTDGLLVLYIWDLEVIPAHRGQGIEADLLRRMLERHGHVYQVNAHPSAQHAKVFEAAGFVRYSPDDAIAMTRMQMQWQDGGPKPPPPQ